MNLLGTHAKNGPRPDYRQALLDSLVKLNPLYLWKDSPVMLVVEAGFALVLAMGLAPGAFAGLVNQSRWFYFVIAGILLLTVWFSTFSEAVSEAQGRARVDALRTLEKDVPARKIVGDSEVIVPSRFLDPGDVVRASAGEFIPRDGVIKEGKAYIDESMMTGESIPSYKETGSHVIGGTKVATDSILITIVAEAGKSYLDQMISLVENAKRPKSASEVSLTILLVGLTAIFVVVCSAFLFLADHLGLVIDLAILISLLVALMPTTIGGLLPAIGVAGIARVGGANVVAKSGKAVEAAGDVDILILDKTGTITEGQRTVKEFVPLKGYTKEEVGQAAYLASIYDQTPEGRSIIEVSKENGWVLPLTPRLLAGKSIDFSAESRVSGVELFVPRPGTLGIQELPTAPPEAAESRIWRLLLDLEVSGGPAKLLKGAVDAILDLSPEVNEAELLWQAQEISKTGGTPIAVAVDRLVVGLINLRDNLKPHIREKLDAVRATGIKTVMVTGDAELTARVIAQEAGIDEVMAGAKPADKLVRVELEQKRRHERRAGPRQGRRRDRDEQRDLGGPRGGEHGRPRLGPREDPEGRRGRETAPDDPRGHHDVQRHERHREVLHALPGGHPGQPGGPPPRRHAAPQPGHRGPRDDDLQRGDHPRPHPALPEGREVPGGADAEDLRPEHGDLWPRRRGPSVPRDQGDRPAPGLGHRVR